MLFQGSGEGDRRPKTHSYNKSETISKKRKNCKNLKIQIPEKIAEIILKFELCVLTEWQTVYIGPDQKQSDLDLHCLPRPVCLYI